MALERPWVLLRGLGREARHWGDFGQILSVALGGVPVHTPDLPGNGRWWQQASGTSIRTQRDHLRAQLAPVLNQGPVNLLALSLGGMVALDWAGHLPDEVARLVLVNTSLAGIAPFWRRLRWQRYPALLSLAWSSVSQRERLILALTSNLPERRAAALPYWQAWQQEAPVSAINLLRQLYAAARFAPPALWPQCPTLVVTSAQDQLVDPFCSAQLAYAAGWPLQINGHAGHDLPLDDPCWLAQTVVQWHTASLSV
ncbi:pimeloyl-ACP methyl ester carboxylesterase [Silvimonas terrae]|uniref:Pimeloyl-ACP methyl ester carboxylesterase n=1 Tax=Silvimonas terrae TaxID=300266 RepID=A0A840RF04_9NEIS|nr:alpha/beta fold hydrolase [Silvimonas terrae]MBB5191597.1 pimeloyl-ACP methyl ester carboxylesterase [Silvimonas terrae]